MSAPTQTTGTVPATHSEINTVSQVAPPAYNDEKSSAAPVVGQPRTDDPARQEMAYGSSQANPPLMVTPRESLRQEPAWIDCPFCQKRSITDVRKVNSDTTWLYTFLCCICCGICLVIPLIFGWGADFDHYCKTCNNRVARVPHDGASNATVQVFSPTPAQVTSTAGNVQHAPQKA